MGTLNHPKVFVSGEIDPESCWFMDFGDFKTIVNPLIELLDHHALNDIKDLENPTSESLIVWI